MFIPPFWLHFFRHLRCFPFLGLLGEWLLLTLTYDHEKRKKKKKEKEKKKGYFLGFFLLIESVHQSIQERGSRWKSHAYPQRFCQWLKYQKYQKQMAADVTKLQTPLVGVLRVYHEEFCHRRYTVPYRPALHQCWTADSLWNASAVHCGVTATSQVFTFRAESSLPANFPFCCF